jgi:hypothetical protein
MAHNGCGLFGLLGDRMRLFDRTACRAIRDIRSRKFKRPSIVAAAGVEFRSMVSEGEQVSLKKLIESKPRGVDLCEFTSSSSTAASR